MAPPASTQKQPTPSKAAPPPQPTSGLLPPIPAVTLLSDRNAQTFVHVHTALIPLIYIAGFRSIVADPVSALTALLLPISVLQGAYCALCLPPSSGSASAEKTRRKPGAPAAKPAHWSARITPTLLSLASSLLLAPPVLFALLVAHGAPLTTHHTHTALLALHVSLLSTPALFYTRGLDGQNWRQIVSLSAPVDECMGAAMGALLGCWLGAVPIPLDWDREWQKWPVTVCSGAYGGWVLGKVGGGTVAWGRTVDFE